jgi:hypothetical protein
VTAIIRLLVFARKQRVAVLAGVAGFTLLASVLCLNLSFSTDVLSLLPQHDPSLQGFRQYLERFGAADHLYIVFGVPKDVDIQDSAPLVDAYVERLRGLPEIAEVDAGLFDADKDWAYLQDRTFALIGPAATRDALGRFSEQGIRNALLQSRDLLGTPSPDVQRLVQADPLGLLALVRDRLSGDQSFSTIDAGRHGYLSADGRSRLVMATPSRPAFDSEFCRRLFESLAAIETQTRAAVAADRGGGRASPVQIQYAGGHRIAVETESILKKEATLNSLLSVASIVLLLVLVFRSMWLFFVCALPMTVATLGAIAVNGLMRDELSAAATGTSALLFGLGIDGLVLMYARYLEELEAGEKVETAIVRIGGAGTSMLLGYLTTAATFFGLTWIDLPGLQELGRLVGVGMLLGGPLTLLIVAALLPARVTRPRALSAMWLARLVRQYRWSILIGTAVVTAIAIPLASTLTLDARLERLQPATPAVQLQQEVGQRFGVDRDVALALTQGASLDALLIADRQLEASLRSRAPGLALSGPGRFLPPAVEQVETGKLLDAAALDVPVIQARIRSIASEIGFRPGALDDFIGRLPRMLDPQQRLTYEGYLEHGLGDIMSRFIVKDPNGFTTLGYIEVKNADDLANAHAAVAASGSGATLTGIPVVNAALSAGFGRQFLLAMLAGSAVVFLLIVMMLRNVRLTLLALSPTILGLIWAAAILSEIGISLDLFSVFAVLTLIGIGVDYGIHLVHRTASERDQIDTALARVAPANIVAAGIALLGVGSLAVSSYPPLRTLGIVTVVGLCTCLVTAVLVLPALLMVTTRGRHS